MFKRLLIILILSANLIILISCADDQARNEIADTNTKLNTLQAKLGVINTKISNQKMIEILNKQDDLQSQINQLNNQISTLMNTVKTNQDTNTQLLQSLQKQLDTITTKNNVANNDSEPKDMSNPSQKDSPDDSMINEQLEKAKADIKSHRFQQASVTLNDIINNYDENNSNVIDAHYYLMVTETALRKYNDAISKANDFIQQYPDNKFVPDVLMIMYICYQQLDNKIKSKLILHRIIKNYPNSDAAKKLRLSLL